MRNAAEDSRNTFDEELGDEVARLFGNLLERLVVEIVFGDGHVGHRLHVRFAHERRQTR